MLKLACDCPRCKARIAREAASILSGLFTDEEAARIARECARDFGSDKLATFLGYSKDGTDD